MTFLGFGASSVHIVWVGIASGVLGGLIMLLPRTLEGPDAPGQATARFLRRLAVFARLVNARAARQQPAEQ